MTLDLMEIGVRITGARTSLPNSLLGVTAGCFTHSPIELWIVRTIRGNRPLIHDIEYGSVLEWLIIGRTIAVEVILYTWPVTNYVLLAR